jgi:hypothetical protein
MVLNSQAKEFLIHPEYQKIDQSRSKTLENDVAILLFSDSFNITYFVRPVCLWNSDYYLSSIVNVNGMVRDNTNFIQYLLKFTQE